jgi:hypothetical protein
LAVDGVLEFNLLITLSFSSCFGGRERESRKGRKKKKKGTHLALFGYAVFVLVSPGFLQVLHVVLEGLDEVVLLVDVLFH